MRCEFERVDPETVECSRCRLRLRSKRPLWQITARCLADVPAALQQQEYRAQPCVYRGEQTSTIGCAACGGGSVEVPIFACALHEECTVRRAQPDIACCGRCDDYTATVKKEAVRVGLIFPSLVVGGVERWLCGLLKHFPKSVEVTGVALADGAVTDEAICREVSRSCRVLAGPMSASHTRHSLSHIERRPTAAAAIQEIADRSDVLIVWGIQQRVSIPDSFSGPVVLCSHGNCQWTRNWVNANLERATHLTAVSADAAKSFPAEIRDRVQVLWNGIEFDRLTPAVSPATIRRSLDIRDDQHVVGFLGRFSPEKNPLAVARAVGQIENAIALYVGIGWKDSQFRQEATELARGRIRFVIAPQHVGDYLAAFDCLMLPSPAEGFCLAITEAWGAGIPVVATHVGSVPDVERLYGTVTVSIGFPGTAEEHAAAVLQAIRDGKGHPRVTRAREIAWSHFSAAAMARRWADYLTTDAFL